MRRIVHIKMNEYVGQFDRVGLTGGGRNAFRGARRLDSRPWHGACFVTLNMNTQTLVIILVVLLVLGGGGFYWRGRR